MLASGKALVKRREATRVMAGSRLGHLRLGTTSVPTCATCSTVSLARRRRPYRAKAPCVELRTGSGQAWAVTSILISGSRPRRRRNRTQGIPSR